MEEVYVPAINADSDPWTLPLEDIDIAMDRPKHDAQRQVVRLEQT